MSSIVVIGGGIAGLATAALAQRSGHNVTLLEARPDVGGRAGSWEQSGFQFDTGPSWFLMPEVFDHFFKLMGTSTEEQLTLQRLDPGYRVFFEGHNDPVDVVSGRASAAALFDRLEPGSGKRLARYLDSAASTYQLAIDNFLYSTFESFRSMLTWPVLRHAWRLTKLLTTSLERYTASQFSDERLRKILGYPAVFLGTSPDRLPSLYHLMSHLDLDEGVWYPTGGFRALIAAIEALARAEGVDIRTNTMVTAINTREIAKGAQITGVRAIDATGNEFDYSSDVVVSAADLHHTETELVPEHLRTYPEAWWKERSPGPGAVLAYLGVEGQLNELAHHSLFFTNDWHKNFDAIYKSPTSIPDPASVYASRTSATDPSTAPAGHENLFLLIPVPADPTIGHGGIDRHGDPAVEAVVDTAIHEISHWAQIPNLDQRITVRRTVGPADFATDLHSWQGGALGPGHTLRQSAMLRGRNASSKVHGLYYAGGTTIPGIGLPMCLISAELVIKRLNGDRSATPLATLA